MPWTSYGVGQYVASEAHQAILPRNWKADGTIRGVIFCHGAGSNALSWTAYHPELLTLARNGFPVLSCALGGTDTWGNDTSQTRVGQAWTFFKSNFGVKTDKFHLLGASMGGLVALRYAKDNAANVKSVSGILPTVDPDDIHDNDRGGLGFAAGIETAFTNLAGWNTAEPSVNPNTTANRSTYAGLGIPTKIWADTADTICLSSLASAFATAAGASYSVSGAAGHVFPVTGLNHYALLDHILTAS